MIHRKHYDLLIAKARDREPLVGIYTEKHHVIPRSKGGGNGKENIVVLTAREHFIAHCLLAYMYGGGMWQAVRMMRVTPFGTRQSQSKMYSVAKEKWAKSLVGVKRPEHVGLAVSAAMKGKKHSEESRKARSERQKGKPRTGDPSSWKWSSEESKRKAGERMSQRAPKYDFNGEMLTMRQAAEKYQIGQDILRQRISTLKIDPSDAVSFGVLKRGVNRNMLKPLQHGKRNTYENHKCRCNLCVEAIKQHYIKRKSYPKKEKK